MWTNSTYYDYFIGIWFLYLVIFEINLDKWSNTADHFEILLKPILLLIIRISYLVPLNMYECSLDY